MKPGELARPQKGQLSRNRVSDNVGPCQALLSTLLHALKEERHFALIDGVAFPTVGS
jgi:hypothetical protein